MVLADTGTFPRAWFCVDPHKKEPLRVLPKSFGINLAGAAHANRPSLYSCRRTTVIKLFSLLIALMYGQAVCRYGPCNSHMLLLYVDISSNRRTEPSPCSTALEWQL